MSRFPSALFVATVIASAAPAQQIGVNVLLNCPPSAAVLEQLSGQGQVLDVLPEINAVMLRIQADQLAAVQALPCVSAAAPDSPCTLAAAPMGPDFASGANLWNLDAINVTNAGTTRTVGYDGAGVYVVVIDTGLPHNWRAYIPEERIASQFAASFAGGGTQAATVSMQPNTWENDTAGHGMMVAGVILGFSYLGLQEFNGVAPRANIIPIKAFHENLQSQASVPTRAIVYVTNLKTSGALGTAPVVINMSWLSSSPDPVLRAAVDAAIAQGIVCVAAGGNNGEAGMGYPAAYPEVISAAASGWVQAVPTTDPWDLSWITNDVSEANALDHYILPFSSRALPGQDLDVAAPGVVIPAPYTKAGQVDYTFFWGTSAACPHIAGVAALMLQKNPGITQCQIETILETTAMPLAPACVTVNIGIFGPGNEPSWSDLGSVIIVPATACFGADATGHGLLQADAALTATPLP